ncbi:ketopantoate reductase family protein [Rhodovibrionaceae bacterium A322]
MRIAIIGAGGVGGYFGARLAASGQDVVFVARGAHKAAMETSGLKVISPVGDLHLPQVNVTDDLSTLGACDVILVCTKLWDNDSLAEALKPAVGPETAVISLQNGVEAEDLFAEVLGEGAVMGGVARISALIESPGIIRHNIELAQLIFGELSGGGSDRAERLRAACDAAGFDAEVAEDIRSQLWQKFIFLAPNAGTACYFREPLAEAFKKPEARELYHAALLEAGAVGRALGINLPDNLEKDIYEGLLARTSSVKPSMLVDLERGNRLELNWLTGGIVRLGEKAGVATPANEKILQTLLPFALGEAN